MPPLERLVRVKKDMSVEREVPTGDWQARAVINFIPRSLLQLLYVDPLSIILCQRLLPYTSNTERYSTLPTSWLWTVYFREAGYPL
ncbi:hypothetical protein PISMIDRAFT_615304 [Pisolithus microcarpus 441]|uniref:Uncharacterized protein n=1 Tax=Pisolithus microcarpus 441 TaxID=765257 RepID=A0A0C9ZQE6_9AGAM|nr:hypothetical protein PISMIDRAFT_615304 [Pisolithus microcarpus 441]